SVTTAMLPCTGLAAIVSTSTLPWTEQHERRCPPAVRRTRRRVGIPGHTAIQCEGPLCHPAALSWLGVPHVTQQRKAGRTDLRRRQRGGCRRSHRTRTRRDRARTATPPSVRLPVFNRPDGGLRGPQVHRLGSPDVAASRTGPCTHALPFRRCALLRAQLR